MPKECSKSLVESPSLFIRAVHNNVNGFVDWFLVRQLNHGVGLDYGLYQEAGARGQLFCFGAQLRQERFQALADVAQTSLGTGCGGHVLTLAHRGREAG